MKKLYRACSDKELDKLINEGYIFPLNHDFISLSTNINIAKQFLSKESNVLITYSFDELFNQGGIEIKYNEEFFKKYPEIALHCDSGGEFAALGKYLEYDVYHDETFFGMNDDEFNDELDKQYKYLYNRIAYMYSQEEEFVIPSIEYNDYLIIDVEEL